MRTNNDDHFDFAANGTDGAWSRRRALAGVGLAGVTVALGRGVLGSAAVAEAAAACTEIPQETAGPYPGDGSNGPNVLSQSGVVRSDIRSSFGSASGTAPGLAVTLDVTIVNANDCTPLAGAAVYVWHCTRDGLYSLYSSGVTGQNYLRGVQVTDADGRVSFTTIFPGCYAGRWPHIHFEVYPDVSSIGSASNAVATSQFALPQAACQTVYAGATGYSSSATNLGGVSLASDNVFSDGASLQLLTATGSVAAGYTLTGVAAVDAPTQVTTAQWQNYVTQAYQDFLGRSPDSGGLTYWTNQLRTGAVARSGFASQLAFSTEGVARFVDGYYAQFLDRSPDTTGRSYWIGRLQAALVTREIVVAIAGSAESYALGGGTDEGFVTRLYDRFLGRSPDSAGLAYWAGLLGSGASGTAGLAGALYDSAESRLDRVADAYQALLGRAPDTSGAAFWAGVILTQGDIALQAFLASSTEYFDRAQT